MARLGTAGCGRVGRGEARLGRVIKLIERRGEVRHGPAGLGMAKLGMARNKGEMLMN